MNRNKYESFKLEGSNMFSYYWGKSIQAMLVYTSD